jgi:hypothetical protein
VPTFDEVLVRKPVILSGGGLFAFASTIDTAESPTTSGVFAVHGGLSRRGVAYTTKDFASFGATQIYLSRLNKFVSTGPDYYYQFGTEFDLPTATTIGNRTTYHLIDGIFWLLGQRSFPPDPFIFAKADGTALTNAGGWVDRSADSGFSGGTNYFMRKASQAGFLYYIFQYSSFGNAPYYIMRGAVATAPNVAFTNVTVTAAQPGVGSAVLAYDVSPDGQVHMFSNDLGTTYVSTDGGVTFGTTVPGISPIEITYSSAFNRWVACSSGGLVRYSDNNGSSWSVPTRLETNPKNAGPFQTFATTYHIERLDSAGRYLIMTSNYAPIRIHFSEDGGKTWVFLQQMMPACYDITQIPRDGSTVTAELALVRTPTSLLLYQGGLYNSSLPYNWNFDNGMFTTGPLAMPY